MANPIPWVACDLHPHDLGPLCDRRFVGDVRTGAMTNVERMTLALGASPAAVLCPSSLKSLVREQHPETPVNQCPAGDAILLIDAAWTGADAGAQETARQLAVGQAIVIDEHPVACCVERQRAAALFETARRSALTAMDVPGVLLDVEGLAMLRSAGPAPIRRPWHILDQLESTLAFDLAWFTAQHPCIDAPLGVTVLGEQPLIALADGGAPNSASESAAQIDAGAILDARKGAIALGRGAHISPGAVVEGPCFIGTGSVVGPQALIRANTVIGPVCKVAGEVSFSIIHGHSNKNHAGFLGHSLVGEWVNFGADTTVSNLKNTYGAIRVELAPGRGAEDTGRQFHGPIVGDFVRTAIGSRLNTGSCIGTGTMLATSSFAPKCTGPMRFITDHGDDAYDVERFLDTARAMMARRGRTLGEADEARLRALAAE